MIHIIDKNEDQFTKKVEELTPKNRFKKLFKGRKKKQVTVYNWDEEF